MIHLFLELFSPVSLIGGRHPCASVPLSSKCITRGEPIPVHSSVNSLERSLRRIRERLGSNAPVKKWNDAVSPGTRDQRRSTGVPVSDRLNCHFSCDGGGLKTRPPLTAVQLKFHQKKVAPTPLNGIHAKATNEKKLESHGASLLCPPLIVATKGIVVVHQRRGRVQ